MRRHNGRPVHAITVTEEEREELTKLKYNGNVPDKVAMRAQIILLAGEGHDNHYIAEYIGISDSMASHWRMHWLEYPQLTATERCLDYSDGLRKRVLNERGSNY